MRVRAARSFNSPSLSASKFVRNPGLVVFPILAYISLVIAHVKGGIAQLSASHMRHRRRRGSRPRDLGRNAGGRGLGVRGEPSN